MVGGPTEQERTEAVIATAAPELAQVVHDYPAAVLLIDTVTDEVVFANDLARQLAPDAQLPLSAQAWSRAAGLQVAGGANLAASDTPLTQVALGRPAGGREVSAELGSQASASREALWVIGLPLSSAPEPLRSRSLVVLLPLRYPEAVADLQHAAQDADARHTIVTSDLAMTITDPTQPDEPLIWVSDGFERVTGYRRGEVLGRNCRFLQGRDTDPASVQRLREAAAAGTAVSQTLLNYRADGTAFYNHLVISPVYDDTGRLTHRVGIQSDVTQRVLAEREQAAAVRAVRSAEGARDAAQRAGALGRLLLSLSEALSITGTVEEVAATVAEVTSRELGVAATVLAVPGADGLQLLSVDREGGAGLRTASGRSGSEGSAGSQGSTGSVGPAPDSATALAAASGRAAFYSDAQALLAAHPSSGRDQAIVVTGASAHLPLDLTRPDGRGALRRAGGALVLLWDHVRDLGDDEREALAALGRYTSGALSRAQLLAERRSAAQVLQESLLTTLPEVEHLSIRARYVPAAAGEHVGGDWYDAIRLPGGSTAVVIGDVAGHDIAAAAQMGQLRGLLRAFAHDRQEAPSQVLRRVERSMPDLGITVFATAVLTIIEAPAKPCGGTTPQRPHDRAAVDAGEYIVRWSNAGHPPPLVIDETGATRSLSSDPELVLGVVDDAERSDHVVALPSGSTLLLYTDGFIEHRDEDLQQGLEELCATVERHAHLPLEEMLDALVREIVGDHPDDDCAVIGVHLHP